MLRQRCLEFGDLGGIGADEPDRRAGRRAVSARDGGRGLQVVRAQRVGDLGRPLFGVALPPGTAQRGRDLGPRQRRPASGVGAIASTATASLAARSVPNAASAAG